MPCCDINWRKLFHDKSLTPIIVQTAYKTIYTPIGGLLKPFTSLIASAGILATDYLAYSMIGLTVSNSASAYSFSLNTEPSLIFNSFSI